MTTNNMSEMQRRSEAQKAVTAAEGVLGGCTRHNHNGIIMSVIQEIQEILQRENEVKKAVSAAEGVLGNLLDGCTRHNHNNEFFYCKEDSNQKLVFLMERELMEAIENVLQGYSHKDYMKKRLIRIMEGGNLIPNDEFIHVEGSDSPIYSKVLNYTTNNKRCKKFLEYLEQAIAAELKPFDVPVCDMYLCNGVPCWGPGHKPAVGLSYAELEEIEFKYGLTLGTVDQYILFVATMIVRLMEEKRWALKDTIYAFCCNSNMLASYSGSMNHTGDCNIAGKRDLANTYKILKKSREGIPFASGRYDYDGKCYPIANIAFRKYDTVGSVGWFVF